MCSSDRVSSAGCRTIRRRECGPDLRSCRPDSRIRHGSVGKRRRHASDSVRAESRTDAPRRPS
ncbi:hypothetical protein NJ7G_4192 [Natrinema sp. J7-2]|nr:hypothetical protein NJ7G_4192 [Natrinema sp. J7-2]